MSQPLYFLPGMTRETLTIASGGMTSKINREVLADRGLSVVFADVTEVGRDAGAANTSKGPDDRSGCLLWYTTPNGSIPQLTSYTPHAQTWTKISDKLYIGIANDAPPTEADLRRKKMFPGAAIEMAGDSWTVPVIRRCIDAATSLPTDLLMDDAGNVTKPVKRAYGEVFERFREVGDWFFSTGEVVLDEPRFLRMAVEALSLNYRIGIHEQNILRIIDSESFLVTLAVAVDYIGAKQLQDAQKKTNDLSADEISTAG